MKTLYIHMGAPKTGSTAIQTFLEQNSKRLYQDGILFRFLPFTDYTRDLPVPTEDGSVVFVNPEGASGKVPEKRNAYFLHGKSEPGFDEENRHRLKEGLLLIDQWFQEKEAIVLSDEYLWITAGRWDFLEQVRDFCKEHQITVKLIVYLRQQDEYLDSYYRQRIKLYFRTERWEDFLQQHELIYDCYGIEYEKRLDWFSSLFGKENVIVRPYEPKLWAEAGSSIYQNFADILGLDIKSGYVLPSEDVNPSQNHNYTEIQRIINRLHNPSAKYAVKTRQFFQNAGIRCSEMHKEDTKLRYWSDGELERICSPLEAGNQKAAREYLGRDRFFEGRKKEAEQWLPDTPEMQEDIILYFGELNRLLFRDLMVLKEENQQLKRFSLGYRIYRFFKKIKDKLKKR